jgi:hypothetical protein
VHGAGKVLVQNCQSSELIVTNVALETVAVPGPLSRLISLVGASDHSIRVRDEVVSVELRSQTIDALTSDTRAAATSFEMQNECGWRNKLEVAIPAKARYRLRAMSGGIEVLRADKSDQLAPGTTALG